MSAPPTVLQLFAYGENLEGVPPRSLGYRLLAPVGREPWCDEVESLARGLQAAPYPDHWPPTDLFCSVLLADGRRVVAIARYGLADHTPTQRRGGLELVGVVVPGGLGVSSALAISQWLRQRRAATDDLRGLTGQCSLTEVLTAAPAPPPPAEPVPVLPIRLWQDGVLLFAATAPSDPDHRLGLLQEDTGRAWQWLPLVGADFPLQSFAQRGPLVAWTPHLAGVALKLDRKPAEDNARPLVSQRGRGVALVAALVLLLLFGANLWAFLDLRQRLATGAPPPPATPQAAPTPLPDNRGEAARERFAQALYRLLQKQGNGQAANQSQLIAQYERLVMEDEALRVSTPEGKAAVGAVSLLARLSPKQIEAAVREALTNKGYDPRLIDLACQRVHERLLLESKEAP